jgi:hypothetical protein
MASEDKLNALEVILFILREQEKKLDSLLDKMETVDQIIKKSPRR